MAGCRRWLLVLLALLGHSTPLRAEDDKPAEEQLSPEELKRRQAERRQALEQRKVDLPKASKRALQLLEDFRARDLRLWSVQRNRVVAEGEAAVPALLVMLEETDWEVRAFAASCLEKLAPPEALRPLIRALRKEKKYVEARRRMVRALAALKSPEAEATLTEAASDKDNGIALAAVRALGALRRKESIPALEKHLTNADLDIRYEALGSLAALGSKTALERLQKAAKAQVATADLRRFDAPNALDMKDRYEQFLLGVALARAEDKGIDKLLRDVLQAKKPWARKTFLRLGGAKGLGVRTASGGSLHPGLLKGLKHDDTAVRVACSYGLSFVATPEILGGLKRARTDSQLDVRVNVVRALGRVGTADAVKELRKSLRDRSPDVRAATARALADASAPEAAGALIAALNDKKYVIRVIAARGLGRRAEAPGVVAALTKAAKDADYGVRAQVLASISQAGGQAATVLPVLVAAIGDRDPGVRASACLGVSNLLDRAAEKPPLDAAFLKRATDIATKTSVERLRRAAVELLDAQRPGDAVPLLLAFLDADKEETRRRANSLLQRMSETSVNYDSEASPAERAAAIKRWQAWWKQHGKLPPRVRQAGMVVTGSLAEQTRDLKWRGLDLVLLLDSTGSMAGLLRSAKQSIDEIIAEMASPLPSLRIALFTYRDFGDDYVYYGTPLTFDLVNLPGFLQSFVHGQGGDIPEAVKESVSAVMKRLWWRPDAHKVAIFAGDAPHRPELDKEFKRDVKRWATRENRAVLHAIFTDTNRRSLDVNKRRAREDPDDFNHPYFEIYKDITNVGQGRAVLLSDESALIKEILVLAFGPAWRADIENFLDFRN